MKFCRRTPIIAKFIEQMQANVCWSNAGKLFRIIHASKFVEHTEITHVDIICRTHVDIICRTHVGKIVEHM